MRSTRSQKAFGTRIYKRGGKTVVQCGYTGNILRVNLSSGSITCIPTRDYAERFIGGRGFAVKIHWDEVAPEVSAFDPENRLVFSLGPLAGFPIVGGSRWQVTGKSPASSPEQFSYCNLGGYWGVKLKFAGYDGLVVQGKSDKPVYLFLGEGIIEIRDASALWGKTCIETREILKQELGSSVGVVACGPAGENMVRFASLLADGDASGSSGLGAVMGSKRLKAIAVRGKGKAIAADPERFLELTKYVRKLKEDWKRPSNTLMPQYGSKVQKDFCYGCIGACIRRTYEAQDGTKAKFCCMGPVLYTERARRYYGELNDVPFLAAKLCDHYGIDQDVITNMIMWLSRCHKAGVLTDEGTGIPLSKLGSLEFIDTLVKKISYREGFGDVLAHGIHEAAEIVGKGSKQFIKDYTLKAGKNAEYCPRMYIAHGILHAMEPRQPINQLHELIIPLFEWTEWFKKSEGFYLSTEVFRRIARRFWGSELAADFSTYEGKALAAVRIQDRSYAKESLILCDFMWPITYVKYSEDHVGDPTVESKLFSAVTGKETSEEELYSIGERIFNVQRAILAREGHRGRGSDILPETFYTIPLTVPMPYEAAAANPEILMPGKDGEPTSRKGAVVEREKFERMKDEYYQLRGWDVASGLQTKKKLVELGLDEVAKDLEQRGLIAIP